MIKDKIVILPRLISGIGEYCTSKNFELYLEHFKVFIESDLIDYNKSFIQFGGYCTVSLSDVFVARVKFNTITKDFNILRIRKFKKSDLSLSKEVFKYGDRIYCNNNLKSW